MIDSAPWKVLFSSWENDMTACCEAGVAAGGWAGAGVGPGTAFGAGLPPGGFSSAMGETIAQPRPLRQVCYCPA